MDHVTVGGNRAPGLAGIVAIMGLSLVLLGYVGLGEAYRTYPTFEIERLAAQGEIVKTSMSAFLAAGLPVDQFPGFRTQTQPLLDSDPSIAAIFLLDPRGQVVAVNARASVGNPARALQAPFQPSTLSEPATRFQAAQTATDYRVTLPLRNKFEQAGDLVLLMPRSFVAREITTHFVGTVLRAGVALLLLFALAALVITRRGERSESQQRQLIQIAYGAVFVVMAAIVVYTLVGIYSDGVRDKTRALANSLSERLSVPLELGLKMSDFSHVDAVFSEYKALYPELSYVALTDGSVTTIDTDPARVGTAWTSDPSDYEYAAPLAVGVAGQGSLRVRVGIPRSVIFGKVWRSIKNFAVLFLATGFVAILLLNLLSSLSHASDAATVPAARRGELQLGVVQPFLFLAVLVEGLSASFLPLYLERLARGAALDPGIVATQFTVYFAAYAAVLLPIGRVVEEGKAKPVLIIAMALELASLVLMATIASPALMFPVRAMAGAAQGMILTGVQAYYFGLLPPTQQARGGARVGLVYNSALISATAIGALLAVYMGDRGVFAVAAATAALVLAYAVLLLPGLAPTRAGLKNPMATGQEPAPRRREEREEEKKLLPPSRPSRLRGERPSSPGSTARPTFARSLAEASHDGGFLRALFLVGIPAKSFSTGVTAFAMPPLLAQMAFSQEDIGQIIMFYPLGIVLSSTYLTRLVDSKSKPGQALFYGTLGGGIGLILIGLVGWGPLAHSSVPALGTLVLIGGMLTLGLAHGFVVGPIVGYVAGSATAGRLGRSPANSLYRSLERIGHMGGPILVSQLLLLNHGSALTITWIGLAAIFLGLIFWLSMPREAGPKLQAVSP